MGDVECPERVWVWPCDHGGVQVEHGPVQSNYPCHECGATSVEYVRADAYRGAVEEHRAFVDALTQALNDHGVPAMPSWREAIDWLAANGGGRP